jgi:hypothetical protein
MFAWACRTPLVSSHREQRVGASCSGERLSRDVRAILKRRSPRQQRRGATVCQCHCGATWSCRISFESSHREQRVGASCSGERLSRDVRAILKRRSPRQQRRGATVCQCHCCATRSCRISFESSRREQSDGGSGERLARDVKSRECQFTRHSDPTVTRDQQLHLRLRSR